MANHKKTHSPRKAQHHLPKVGTPADDAYRLERSRRDLLDFGRLGGGRGAGWVLGLAALVVLVLVVIGLIAIT